MLIHALNARFGDSLLITWGRPTRAMLIDTGVGKTYAESIKPALTDLIAKGVRALEVVVITHLDRDHIGGAQQLLREAGRLGIAIRDIWFNGERHLPGEVPRPRGFDQAERLADLILQMELPWNLAFGGKAIKVSTRGGLPSVRLAGGMRITILSPQVAQLKRLAGVWPQAVHDAEVETPTIRARGPSVKRPPVSLPVDWDGLGSVAFREDDSAANGSSLALLLEVGNRAALMTGDAYPSVVAASWRRLVRARGAAPRLQLLKLSHHGSSTNTSPALLSLLRPEKLLVSTDGSAYGHPHAETLAWAVHQLGSTEWIFNVASEYAAAWQRAAKSAPSPLKVITGTNQGALVAL